jgi:hypothetical protein
LCATISCLTKDTVSILTLNCLGDNLATLHKDNTKFIGPPKRNLQASDSPAVRGQFREILDSLNLLTSWEQRFVLASYLLPRLSVKQQMALDQITEKYFCGRTGSGFQSPNPAYKATIEDVEL